jgi:streptomycin 6-kinase
MAATESESVGARSPLIPFEIPASLAKPRPWEPGWQPWIDTLPRLVRDVMGEWGLSYDGAPMSGYGSLVLPVRMADGRPAAAKFAWPHDEEEHEHLLMQALHGDGMALLYRADPRRHAMLLERLDFTRDLNSVEVIEACEIIAALYERIHIPAMPQLKPLSSYIARWSDDLSRVATAAPIPRRLVEQALALGADFVADPATVGRAIHGDLHYENVLAGEREPWIVIDPKPMSGDPHYEVAPLLWNRWDEVIGSGDARHAIRARFHTVVDAAGLDEARARDWVVVRMIHNAMWAINDDPGLADPDTSDWITTSITIAKAVQD